MTEKIKWYNNKKVWLIISLAPYLYAVIYSIVLAAADSYGKAISTVFESFINELGFRFIDDFLLGIFEKNPLSIFFIIALVYQIWFITQSKISFGKIKLSKILLILSIICWSLYFIYPIFAYFYGFSYTFFTTSTDYGFEAVKSSLIWNLIKFSIIPVLPISLIIIIVSIARGKSAKKE